MFGLLYNSTVYDANTGAINFASDTFKVMLVMGSYVPDVGSHTKRSDVTGEASGIGYEAGGKSVSVTVTKDTANNIINISLGDAVWPNSTITADLAVYYKSRGGNSIEDELVGCIVFERPYSSINGPFSISESVIQYGIQRLRQ